MTLRQQLSTAFQQHFGEAPTYIIRAPGRVNLIGEHTDYNDGFVLPMAINRAAWIALRPRIDQRVIAHSLEFDESIEFDLTHLHKRTGWTEYLKGTAWSLLEAGYSLHGWEGVVAGDVPIGAGLSSSAALELATARTFSAISNFDWDAATMAKVCQRAENEWVGMNCGIMDQMISAAGKADHALLIDCRSLDTDLVPLPPGTVIVILDTSTRRGLVDSAYNERREQCEAAAEFFNVPALRDVSLEQFEAQADQLDDLTMRRARHVITENARTVQAKDAMLKGDAAELGRLMDASHVSMRDDFEISGDALNAIVTAARQHPACFGARMTGGGFAGCAVALVQTEAAEDFAARVAASYEADTGLTPHIYICTATNGAEIIQGA